LALALAPNYGNTPEEVATLRKLVRLWEEKNEVVSKERFLLEQERLFYRHWYEYVKKAICATPTDKEIMGPEPQLSDYLSIARPS